MIHKRTKGRASWHRTHDLGCGGKRTCPRRKLQGGQMVKGLERFAMEFRLHCMGTRELGKVLRRTARFEKDNSAAVWRRTPQEANPFGGTSSCGIIAIFLS